MLTRNLAMLLFLGVSLGWPMPADASGDCPPGQTPTKGPGGAWICIPAIDPGEPPSPGDAEPPPGQGCYRDNGEEVPCENEDGVWFSSHDCYGAPYDLPADDPAWIGHEGQTVWQCLDCDSAASAGTCQVYYIWIPDGQPGEPVDPGELAQTSIGQLGLKTAIVRMAPQDPDVGVVGVETWLWVPAAQWTTLSKTVTAGVTSVTVTAVPERVTWDVGPETTVCTDAGRAWVARMGDAAVTSCGYTYATTSKAQPEGVFAVSARIGYRVDWACVGSCTAPSGSLGIVDAPAGGGRLRVVQRQTVVVTR